MRHPGPPHLSEWHFDVNDDVASLSLLGHVPPRIDLEVIAKGDV
jgi:hypothetical protein